jgi:hypothetical protein
MNSENSIYSEERTEEQMNESCAPRGLFVAAAVTGIVIGAASMQLMKWNDKRKAKKNSNPEN